MFYVEKFKLMTEYKPIFRDDDYVMTVAEFAKPLRKAPSLIMTGMVIRPRNGRWLSIVIRHHRCKLFLTTATHIVWFNR